MTDQKASIETMSREEIIFWLEMVTEENVRLVEQVKTLQTNSTWTDSHNAARIARLEHDLDALETENAQLEENAQIVAARLCGSIDIVTGWQDTVIRRFS
jgi:hypothetical protein